LQKTGRKELEGAFLVAMNMVIVPLPVRYIVQMNERRPRLRGFLGALQS